MSVESWSWYLQFGWIFETKDVIVVCCMSPLLIKRKICIEGEVDTWNDWRFLLKALFDFSLSLCWRRIQIFRLYSSFKFESRVRKSQSVKILEKSVTWILCFFFLFCVRVRFEFYEFAWETTKGRSQELKDKDKVQQFEVFKFRQIYGIWNEKRDTIIRETTRLNQIKCVESGFECRVCVVSITKVGKEIRLDRSQC